MTYEKAKLEVTYCIGVDEIGQPIIITHFI